MPRFGQESPILYDAEELPEGAGWSKRSTSGQGVEETELRDGGVRIEASDQLYYYQDLDAEAPGCVRFSARLRFSGYYKPDVEIAAIWWGMENDNGQSYPLRLSFQNDYGIGWLTVEGHDPVNVAVATLLDLNGTIDQSTRGFTLYHNSELVLDGVLQPSGEGGQWGFGVYNEGWMTLEHIRIEWW